jgi:hypothetical protein
LLLPSQLRESIGAAEVLRIFEERFWIEAADLPTDAAIVCGGIERVDCRMPLTPSSDWTKTFRRHCQAA